jgi:hypothetical protein
MIQTVLARLLNVFFFPYGVVESVSSDVKYGNLILTVYEEKESCLKWMYEHLKAKMSVPSKDLVL